MSDGWGLTPDELRKLQDYQKGEESEKKEEEGLPPGFKPPEIPLRPSWEARTDPAAQLSNERARALFNPTSLAAYYRVVVAPELQKYNAQIQGIESRDNYSIERKGDSWAVYPVEWKQVGQAALNKAKPIGRAEQVRDFMRTRFIEGTHYSVDGGAFTALTEDALAYFNSEYAGSYDSFRTGRDDPQLSQVYNEALKAYSASKAEAESIMAALGDYGYSGAFGIDAILGGYSEEEIYMMGLGFAAGPFPFGDGNEEDDSAAPNGSGTGVPSYLETEGIKASEADRRLNDFLARANAMYAYQDAEQQYAKNVLGHREAASVPWNPAAGSGYRLNPFRKGPRLSEMMQETLPSSAPKPYYADVGLPAPEEEDEDNPFKNPFASAIPGYAGGTGSSRMPRISSLEEFYSIGGGIPLSKYIRYREGDEISGFGPDGQYVSMGVKQ